MYSVNLKDVLSSDDLRGRLNLDSIERCVKNRKLEWHGYVERMDGCSWVIRCGAVEAAGSVHRKSQRKPERK